MVSFSCESCQDTIKKPKLENHASWCRGPFTCIDCNTTFQGRDWKGHIKCISEEQKYQKGDRKENGQKKAVPQNSAPVPEVKPAPPVQPPTQNGTKEKKPSKKDKKSVQPEVEQEPQDKEEPAETKVKKQKKEKKEKKEKTEKKEKKEKTDKKEKKDEKETEEKKEEKKKKRKASELETETADQPSDSNSKKKKKSKKDTNEDSSLPTTDFDDTPMPDITTLLLPDLIPTTSLLSTTIETTSIHPSRMRNFTNTDTFATVDPSFLPRKKDILRARKALDRSLHPPPPKPIVKKLTLAEKRAKRAAKKEKRYEEPKPFVKKELVATRDPIDDALEHLLVGVGQEGRVLAEMVGKCKVDVREGGRLLNVNKELYARLGLRREGVQEDGSGGQIVVTILPRKIRARDQNGNNEDGGDDDSDEDSD